MLYSLFSILIAGIFIGTYFLLKVKSKNKKLRFYNIIYKTNPNLNKLLKAVSVILFFASMMLLYHNYAIDSVSLKGNNLFNPAKTMLMIILRTLTPAALTVVMLTPFYKNKYLDLINLLIIPVISILNIAFFKDHLIAMFGKSFKYLSDHRTYGLILVIGILLFSSVIRITNYFIKKDYKLNKKDVLFAYLIFIGISFIFMQQSALQIIFGTAKNKTKGFTLEHRLTIYFTAFFLIGCYVLMRNKSKEDKHLFLSILTFNALFQYFYTERIGLNGLPFHLCNTAVILMFFAHIFKLRGLFYFTYFVNVLGAAFAILLPNISHHALSLESVHFWYNHIHALIIPILGVALRIFDRPNLKMIYRAIGFFTLYYVVVIIINAWFNNYVATDYFFSYGDHITGMLPTKLEPLRLRFTWDLKVGDFRLRFYYVYQIALYLSFVALMFVMWVIYDYLYKVADRHGELAQKRKAKKQPRKSRRNLLISLTNPQFELDIKRTEDHDMIKIENFSKKYAGSKDFAVKDFSLEIKDGEVFGFIGHNGAGKSTVIKSIVGIQSITEGKITIDGYDITKQPIDAKLRLGYVSDNHAVYEKLTGREYVNYIADLYLVNNKDRDERIEKYTKMFNLTDAIDREIKGYSHGMKQKLVVIASLIHNPRVWVLDEPLTGLDPTSAFQIKEVMREHANNGNIVFFSSHVIEVVEKICDKICIIGRGKLIGVYEIAKLKDQGLTLEQLYMEHVAISNINIDAPDAISEHEKTKEEKEKKETKESKTNKKDKGE